ncbi:hypothetical protein Tco_1474958 [Tanacetum coccineum]
MLRFEGVTNTKLAKSSILGKPALQPRKNQSVVRKPTVFKSERPRISKQRFASQVDVNNDLSKPVTTYYLPKERESAVAKPHHMIAPGSSRLISEEKKTGLQGIFIDDMSYDSVNITFRTRNHDHSNEPVHFKGWVPKLFSSRKDSYIRQDKTRGLPNDTPYVRYSQVLSMMGMNVYKGRMPTKIELTLEQSQQGVSNDILTTGVINMACQKSTMLIPDFEDDIMDPVMQCTTLPSHSGFSQQKLISFIKEIHMTSIDFLTPT